MINYFVKVKQYIGRNESACHNGDHFKIIRVVLVTFAIVNLKDISLVCYNLLS